MNVDLVNHPAHYKSPSGLEAIDVIEAFDLGFNTGNAIKYILRHRNKGNACEDLRKAVWYLNRQIDRLDSQASNPAAKALESIQGDQDAEAVKNCIDSITAG